MGGFILPEQKKATIYNKHTIISIFTNKVSNTLQDLLLGPVTMVPQILRCMLPSACFQGEIHHQLPVVDGCISPFAAAEENISTIAISCHNQQITSSA